MRIDIKITTRDGFKRFKNATDAMKFMKTNKAIAISMNNEMCSFADIAELYQLELREKRHNQIQGVK